MMRLLIAFILGAAVMAGTQAESTRPVTKVINLLQAMKDKLKAEEAADAEIFKKMSCWEVTNKAQKEEEMADAKAKIESLTAAVEKYAGQIATLTAEIAELKKVFEETTDALAAATAIRKKDMEAFNKGEADTMGYITQLQDAIKTLSEGTTYDHDLADPTAPTKKDEEDAPTKEFLQKTIRAAFPQYLLAGGKAISHSKIASLLAAPGQARSYSAQSGEVMGVLTTMLEQMEADLKDARDREEKAQAAFLELKEAKEELLRVTDASIETKTGEKADAEEAKAQAEQDLKDYQDTLDGSTKYYMNLLVKAKEMNAEMEERTKLRNAELKAINKCLEILNNPDAQDLFHKRVRHTEADATQAPASFLQTRASKHQRREAAAKVLERVPKLSALAMKVRLDAFTKVKAAIDEMIKELKRQHEEERTHKDFCVKELNENTFDTDKANFKKEDLQTLIAKLTQQIADAEALIATKKEEDAQQLRDLKHAGEQRLEENLNFQAVWQDGHDVGKILQNVQNILMAAYPEAFVQDDQTPADQDPAGPAPPKGFDEYKSKKGEAGGVVALIQQIIEENNDSQKEAVDAEKEAARIYADLVKFSHEVVMAARKVVQETEILKSGLEKDKVAAEEDLETTLAELIALKKDHDELHTACDFTIKNFAVTQKARMEEIDALQKAKDILSGAQLTA